MGQLKMCVICGLALILVLPNAFAQEEEEEDSAEEEDRIVIPEDDFIPSEQISEDNAVPFRWTSKQPELISRLKIIQL